MVSRMLRRSSDNGLAVVERPLGFGRDSLLRSSDQTGRVAYSSYRVLHSVGGRWRQAENWAKIYGRGTPDQVRWGDVQGGLTRTEVAMARYRHGEVSKWVMVRHSGVMRLARVAVQRRIDVVLARGRGTTMAELARKSSSEGVRTTVSAAESDGATWSMSVAPGDSPDVRNLDDGGWHRTSTQA